MYKRVIFGLALAFSTTLFAGCAARTMPVSFVYAPLGETKGGSGELFLASARCDAAAMAPAGELRFVIGTTRNYEGTVTGEMVSQLAPEDLVLDALKRELTLAGYHLECGTAMPAGIAKGVELTAVKVNLEEKAGLSKSEVSGRVETSLEIWQDGKKVRKLSYQSQNSDVAVLERERLPRQLIEQGLHEVMKQAVPEIVGILK